MAIAHDKPKYTVKDYMALPEGERVELINGELLVSPSPSEKHQRISGEIAFHLRLWVKNKKRGRVYDAPFDVVLSKHDVVQPDILFISKERSPIITEANVQGAPDLVIEILSPGHEERDRVVKKSLYEKHGVREYWIVDPDTETLSIFLLKEGKYSLQQTYAKNDTLESPSLAGFSFPLQSIFPPPF